MVVSKPWMPSVEGPQLAAEDVETKSMEVAGEGKAERAKPLDFKARHQALRIVCSSMPPKWAARSGRARVSLRRGKYPKENEEIHTIQAMIGSARAELVLVHPNLLVLFTILV